MVAFVEWLAHRNVETLLRLLESADYFDPQQYNSAFIEGLNELLGRIHDPTAREQSNGDEILRFRQLTSADHFNDQASVAMTYRSISTISWCGCC